MTQLDLPQLSLRRYLDLVKRRRWQVVPVSLLGLLIGGLVAFFIPRMFVAETRIKHAQMPGEGQDSDAQIEAFEDTWHWNASAEDAFDELMRSGNNDAFTLLRAMREFLGDNDMMAYLAMMRGRPLEL